MSETMLRGIPWLKTDPCENATRYANDMIEVCRTPNQCCAKPPGVIHDLRCEACGHLRGCHAWGPSSAPCPATTQQEER